VAIALVAATGAAARTDAPPSSGSSVTGSVERSGGRAAVANRRSKVRGSRSIARRRSARRAARRGSHQRARVGHRRSRLIGVSIPSTTSTILSRSVETYFAKGGRGPKPKPTPTPTPTPTPEPTPAPTASPTPTPTASPTPTPTASPTPTPTASPTPTPTASPTPTPTASPTPTPTSSSRAGAPGFAGGGSMHNLDSTTLNRDLDAMAQAGGRWLRFDFNWGVIQSSGPTSWNWAPFDRIVAAARARGINVLALITYTPAWARPAGTTSKYPPDPTQFATFAKAVVQRYAPQGVHAYEVWNEPNISSFWQPAPNPVAYSELLKAAYPAIKSMDPTATVVSGGTAPAATNGTNYAPIDFVKAMYANGVAGSFDALGHHPYSYPISPTDTHAWNAWYQMFGTTPSLRSTMIANGDGAKKIWATEFGAPTNGPTGSNFVTEAAQATEVTEAFSLFRSYTWAGPLFWYAGRDLGTATTTKENFFGVVRNDFSHKPAFDAFQVAAAGG
jgi:aryl-phospho-beta-D-glucosidase BglC (GH1 family)